MNKLFLNNNYTKKYNTIQIPFTKNNFHILQILEKEGYINIKNIKNKNIIIQIINIKFIKPYKKSLSYKDLTSGYKFGLIIIKTSKGIITDKEAISLKIGGETLFKIY